MERAEASSAAGRFDEAEAAYRRILLSSPALLDAVFARARVLYGAGEYDRAVSSLRVAAEMRPRDVAVAVQLGWTYARSNRLDEASAAFESALSVDPNLPGAWDGLAHTARRRGDHARALDLFGRLSALRPGDAGFRFEAARSLFAVSRFEEAAIAYRALLDADPAAPPPRDRLWRQRALNEMGWSLWRLARVDEAEKAFSELLAIDPDHSGALEGLARVARFRGRHDPALNFFRNAMRSRPGDRSLHEDVARYLLSLDRPDEAAAIFRAILDDPGDPGHIATPSRSRLLAEFAWSLWRAKRIEEAERAFQEVFAIDCDHPGALEGLARIARFRNDHASAVELSYRSLRLRPGDRSFREDFARYLRSLERCEEAAAMFQSLLDEEPDVDRESSEARSRILDALAWTLFRAGRFDEAQKNFREMLAIDPDSSAALSGLAQIARKSDDPATTLKLFQKLSELKPKERVFREEAARALLSLDRFEEAATLLDALLEENPRDCRLLLSSARLRRKQGDAQEAARLLRLAGTLATTADDLVAVGAGFGEIGDFEAAEAAFRGALRDTPEDAAPLFQLGLLARRRGEDEAALAWFVRASAAEPSDPCVLFEVAASTADLQRTAEAAEIMARVEAMPGAAANQRLQLRRLEYACHSMRLDEASAYLATYGDLRDAPTKVVELAAAFYAFRCDWTRVLEIFSERFGARPGADVAPMNEMFVESVARAARATRRQAEVLRALEDRPDLPGPGAKRLRDQLAEELLLLHALGPRATPPAVTPSDPMRARRVARLARTFEPPPEPVSGTLFVCSDRAYLPGAIVVLSSALRHNREALRNRRIRLFLSEDAMEAGAPMVGRLAQSHGLPIEVVPASRFDHSSEGFRVDWGYFSPGHRLSEAAYYRIAAALWLAGQERSGRVVYLDSDVCAGPGLERLFRFDLEGRPLGARMEQADSPSIRRAARKLGIPVERYFNSGVLLLDLEHPEAVPRLREALDVAIRSPERLSYVDQCALNLAFDEQTMALPHEFNFFVRSDTDLPATPSDPPVTHFLARPKPWDPAYPTANSERWLDEFHALGNVLDREQMRYLMATQFGEVSLPSPTPPETSSHSAPAGKARGAKKRR